MSTFFTRTVGNFRRRSCAHGRRVDTLIVNRRIDEAARPVPELLRLNSGSGARP